MPQPITQVLSGPFSIRYEALTFCMMTKMMWLPQQQKMFFQFI